MPPQAPPASSIWCASSANAGESKLWVSGVRGTCVRASSQRDERRANLVVAPNRLVHRAAAHPARGRLHAPPRAPPRARKQRQRARRRVAAHARAVDAAARRLLLLLLHFHLRSACGASGVRACPKTAPPRARPRARAALPPGRAARRRGGAAREQPGPAELHTAQKALRRRRAT